MACRDARELIMEHPNVVGFCLKFFQLRIQSDLQQIKKENLRWLDSLAEYSNL
jgi:hypothetical protein